MTAKTLMAHVAIPILAAATLSQAHGADFNWKKFQGKTITFLAEDRLGFWEVRGYHAVGDPWKEERYA